MNHGLVCWHTDAVAAYVWDLAMSRGEFVAIYTCLLGHGSGFWASTFVRSVGEPAVFDPVGFDQKPGFRHPTAEYARYEPAYDRQFVNMVGECAGSYGSPLCTPILPATAGDEEALRLVSELSSASPRLQERVYDQQPHDKRPKSERRLRDLIRPIRIGHGWALFLGLFHYTTPMVIFVADGAAEVEALSAAVKEDWLHNRLIEEW